VPEPCLSHTYRQWPDALNVHPWPCALCYAADIRNATTNDKKTKTPSAAVSQADRQPKLKDFHLFGCHVYVLDARMQLHQKLPKWEERTCVGINLCQSASHSQSVLLVPNLLTGLVLPQFHVLHDDKFETICDALVPKSQWQYLAELQPTHHPLNNKEYLGNTDSEENCALPDHILWSFIFPSPEQTSTPTTVIVQEDMPVSKEAAENNYSEQSALSNMQEIRRFSRTRKPSLKLRDIMDARAIQRTIQIHVGFEAHLLFNVIEELDIEKVHPIAFAASSDPDILYLHEAMKQPDANHFIQAMEEEIRAHEDKIVSTENISTNTHVLSTIWSMRRKQRIDTRKVLKWKARLTIHGGKQIQGVNYWETFSPVVRWSTI
jgi:hypothetical protein